MTVIQVLLNHGANVDAANQHKPAPLRRDDGWCHPKITEAILAVHADPTARNAAVNGGWHPVRQALCWAPADSGFGMVTPSAYLLLCGEYFISIPRWAEIVLYPDLLPGFKVAMWGLSLVAAKQTTYGATCSRN